MFKKFCVLVILVFSAVHAYAETDTFVATDEPLSGYLVPELIDPNVYARPYSFWDNEVDSSQLTRNTLVLFGAGIGAMGILYLMPSSFTNWEDSDESPGEKWWNNVKDGPVWDKDDFFLNYVTHPYSGAIYYMAARSTGVSAPYSFLYAALLSTVWWEYGIEAFAEVPSKQDLIVTPVAGAILGEGFYALKRYIVANDYELLYSSILGHIVAMMIDPITEIFGGGSRIENAAMLIHP
ncbi:MAG: DUF3943 domain-containing protein, partial [Deferribacteraceae bacterium]|nr:DUF3943 domain-containing protein [Deferribacteraceae bacterium]